MINAFDTKYENNRQAYITESTIKMINNCNFPYAV